MKRTARISRSALYRYHLTRKWAEGLGDALFIMLNPSTADANIDDATIRKCIGFARRWGFGGFEVVNLFAIRSTDPAALKAMHANNAVDWIDIVGSQNDEHLRCAFERFAYSDRRVIVAWGGALKPLVEIRAPEVLALAAEHDIKPRCLGTTKHGEPKHPLMLSYDTPREAYERDRQ